MAAETFEVGDGVILKGFIRLHGNDTYGGRICPGMIVTRVVNRDPNEIWPYQYSHPDITQKVQVSWFDTRGKLHRKVFPNTMLTGA